MALNFIKTVGSETANPGSFFWTIQRESDLKVLLEERNLASKEEAVADLQTAIEELANTVETTTVAELANAEAIIKLTETPIVFVGC